MVKYSYDRRFASIPSRVDLTKWEPSEDRKGRPLKPGDHVRQATYPKGFVEGVLKLSDRRWAVVNGKEVGMLVVETEDGTTYEATGKVLKLK